MKFPKGKTRKQIKGQKDRAEAKAKKSVRAEVMKRERYDCRLYVAVPELIPFGACWGWLEWAHLGIHRQFQTMGMPPQERHTTAGSLALCTWHHQLYDAHKIQIEEGPRGANGPLRFICGQAIYQETFDKDI